MIPRTSSVFPSSRSNAPYSAAVYNRLSLMRRPAEELLHLDPESRQHVAAIEKLIAGEHVGQRSGCEYSDRSLHWIRDPNETRAYSQVLRDLLRYLLLRVARQQHFDREIGRYL